MASLQLIRRGRGSGGFAGDGAGSALSDFLKHAVVHKAAVIPRDLLQFGFLGAGVMMLTGVVAMALPGTNSIRHSGFFLLLGPQAASLAGFLEGAALWAIVGGLVLLCGDLFLAVVPTSANWRWLIVAQATVGGIGALIGVLFLAIVVLNVAIWVAIGAAILAAVGLVLAAMAGG